jgi:lysosomal Pro-X carboxypeptidase
MSTGEDVKNLTDLLRNGFFYMAMTDYPYEASFLNPMPAYPVNVSCKAFESWTPDLDDTSVLDMLADAAKVYFNWNNNTDFCYDIGDTAGTGTLAADGWDVLACNQLAMPQTNGLANTSIFTVEDDTFDYDGYTEDC